MCGVGQVAKTSRVGLLALVGLLVGAGWLIGASALAGAKPVFTASVDARPVNGTVTVTLPGGTRARVRASRQVPVGSTFDVRKGTVEVTAADGKGATYSGQFGQGQFQVLQSTAQGGATEIKLVGTTCKKAAADMPQASVARPRHHAPAHRQLQVMAGGNFIVVGSAGSAIASGEARYSLVDACDGTHIVDQSGKVVAQRKHAPTRTLNPGETQIVSCQPGTANPTYCLLLLSSPRQSVFSFGVTLTQPRATAFRVCYVTPGRARKCFSGSLSQQTIQFGDLACFVNDGRGVYPVRFFVAGHQVGILLHFRATRPQQVFIGSDACHGTAT